MATETNGTTLASLFQEQVEETEGTSKDATEQATERTETTEAEETEEENILDALTKDEPEEEDSKDGQQSVPYKRFQKLISQRNELREAKKEAEGKLAELETATELFSEHYGQFEDPEGQFRLDSQFIKAMDTLYSKDNETIKQAAVIVQEFIKTGKIAGEKESAMPKATRNETDSAVARELWTDRIDSVLDGSPIKPELKTVIRKHAVREFDGKSLTKTRAKEVITEYIKDNEWSAEFMTGKASKPATTAKPATASSARRTDSPAKPQKETEKDSENLTAADMKAKMNEDLRQGFSKLLSQ